MYQTCQFSVSLEAPDSGRSRTLASAIRSAIEYARQNDISGTELLDGSITSIEVTIADRPIVAVSAAQRMLESVLDELDDMGVGGDVSLEGADAVDYLNDLKLSLEKFLKVGPSRNVAYRDGAVTCSKPGKRPCSASLPQEPIDVVVGVEGGVVQGASASRPDVRLTVVDYDTAGADKADLVSVPQAGQQTPCDAYVSSYVADVDPVWVRQVLSVSEKPTESQSA